MPEHRIIPATEELADPIEARLTAHLDLRRLAIPRSEERGPIEAPTTPFDPRGVNTIPRSEERSPIEAR